MKGTYKVTRPLGQIDDVTNVEDCIVGKVGELQFWGEPNEEGGHRLIVVYAPGNWVRVLGPESKEQR